MPHQLSFKTEHTYPTNDLGVVVPVRLRIGDSFIDFDARVDTGASFCIFNRGYAAALGLDTEKGLSVKIGTATGTFEAYGHTVTLTTLGYDFDVMVYFASDAGFSRNVLGRRGWLDQLRLGLIDYEGKMYLSRYDD